MKTLNFFLFILTLALITGCASLTKTQVASVSAYSGILEKFTEYPSAIIKEFIQVKYEVEQLNTGTFSDTIVNSKLWMSYYGRKKALKEAEKIDIGIKIIAEYASALEKFLQKTCLIMLEKKQQNLGQTLIP
jgi:hypothetical protein